MTVTIGGKSVYGATIGILMLDSQFPRILGDIGNAQTWPFPVQYRVIRGASPDKVVRQDPEDLLEDFIVAGRELVASGCDGLVTTCGFLTLFQDRLGEAVGVPVATSSLMQVPWVQSLLPPGKRVGVLTIAKDNLSEAHLRAAGIADPAGVPVMGTEGGQAFSDTILNNRLSLDVAACRQDMLQAASALMAEHPDVGAIVLECTNMTPYAAAVQAHINRPIFSIYSLVRWVQMGLSPTAFG